MSITYLGDSVYLTADPNKNAEGVRVLENLVGPLVKISGMDCYQDATGTEWEVTNKRIICLKKGEEKENEKHS